MRPAPLPVVALLLSVTPLVSAGQDLAVEVHGGWGYTVLQKAEDYYGSRVPDGTLYRMTGEAYAQVFFARRGELELGVEGAWQHLMARDAYGLCGFDDYGYCNYSATEIWRVLGVARLPLGGGASFEAVGGLYKFNSWTDVGAGGALVYPVEITETITVPLKARVDVIWDDTILLPLRISAGIRYVVPSR